MMSTSEILLEYACPAAGMICATIMFSAPYRDAARAISETGVLGDLNPTPWAIMLGNCFGWVGYSMLVDNLFIFFANAPGFILSVWLNMVAVKLQYENHKAAAMRKSMIGALREESTRRMSIEDPSSLDLSLTKKPLPASGAATNSDAAENGLLGVVGDYARVIWEVTAQHQPVPAPHERLVLVVVMYWVAVISIAVFGSKSFGKDTQEVIVGVAVNLNLVFFYGAPLSTIAQVLKERNSATIHIPTIVTSTANGLFWFAFGLAVFDLFIIVPNGLGALLGVVQMFLCVTFPRKKRDDITLPIPTDSVRPLPPALQEPMVKEEGGKPNEMVVLAQQDEAFLQQRHVASFNKDETTTT
ncbi:hypothetical protein ACA910_002822 [Epithemia clementina (nom. ined.)]